MRWLQTAPHHQAGPRRPVTVSHPKGYFHTASVSAPKLATTILYMPFHWQSIWLRTPPAQPIISIRALHQWTDLVAIGTDATTLQSNGHRPDPRNGQNRLQMASTSARQSVGLAPLDLHGIASVGRHSVINLPGYQLQRRSMDKLHRSKIGKLANGGCGYRCLRLYHSKAYFCVSLLVAPRREGILKSKAAKAASFRDQNAGLSWSNWTGDVWYCQDELTAKRWPDNWRLQGRKRACRWRRRLS